MEEECSATETLWCSPALEEPVVLESSTDGATVPEVMSGPMSGPMSSAPPSGAPFMGMYDDGVPPMLARTEPSADGIPPMLRRPDDVVHPRRHGPSPFRPHVSAPSRLDGEDLDLPIQALEGVSAVMEVGSLIADREGEAEGLGVVSDGLGALADTATVLQGYTEYQDGECEEGTMHMMSGAGGLLATGAEMVAPEGLPVSEVIETTTGVVTAGTRVGLGVDRALDGDAAHGIPEAGHGVVDGAVTLGKVGIGPLAGLGPVGAVVVENVIDHGAEGFEANEAAQTFGYEESADGSRDGLNSFEFAVAQGTDAYHGVHDWIAGDAAEGSALETAADVGGGIAGAIVGAGAEVIGLGGDLVAGYGLQSTIDDAWGLIGVD